jgi:putative membrane protein
MRRSGLRWVAVAAIAVIVSGCSKPESTTRRASEQPAGAVGTGGAGANLSDDEFVRDVALKNMEAVELGRLGVARTTDPNIRTFAQRIVDDHGAAAQTLKNGMSGRPIEWPAELDDKQRENADELAKKQGADFDREFVKAVVENQQNLAAKLESRLDVQSLADWKTAAAGRTDSHALPDPGTAMRDVPVRPNKSEDAVTMKINQWAADTYPVAQKHLDTARTLETAAKKRSTTDQ